MHCCVASLNCGNRLSAYEMFICINNFVIAFLMTEILWCLYVDPEVCCTFPTTLWCRIILKLCEGEFYVHFPEVSDVGSFSDCLKVQSVLFQIYSNATSLVQCLSVLPLCASIYHGWLMFLYVLFSCSLELLYPVVCSNWIALKCSIMHFMFTSDR